MIIFQIKSFKMLSRRKKQRMIMFQIKSFKMVPKESQTLFSLLSRMKKPTMVPSLMNQSKYSAKTASEDVMGKKDSTAICASSQPSKSS